MPELTAGRPDGDSASPRLRTAVLYALVVSACFLAGFLLLPTPGEQPAPGLGAERIRIPTPRPVEDFALREAATGEVYGRDRLLGRWTLLYFGYARCPDVCPPTLALLTDVGRRLRARPGWSGRLELVFVTVDPARDTPAVLDAFLPGGMVGLTGSDRQIAGLATQLGIMHLPGRPDAAGDYLVDHPATILLIDPEARLRAGFPFPHDAGTILRQTAEIAGAFHAGRSG